jgi:hypothetical protein
VVLASAAWSARVTWAQALLAQTAAAQAARHLKAKEKDIRIPKKHKKTTAKPMNTD